MEVQVFVIRVLCHLKLVAVTSGSLNKNPVKIEWNSILGYFWFVLILILAIPSFAYIYVNIHDIEKLIDGNYFIIAEVIFLYQWMSILVNQRKFMDLLEFFQQNINEKMRQNREKLYVVAEYFSALFFKAFSILLILAFAGIASVVITLNYQNWKSNVPKNFWIQPIDIVTPFEITDTSTYVYALILSTSDSWSYCLTTICVQIIVADLFGNAMACYGDAQAMFVEIDEIFGTNSQNIRTSIEIKKRLRKIFVYHRVIFYMIRNLQKLLSPIIFAEFTGMIFLLAVIGYPIFQSNSSFVLTVPRMFKFVLLGLLSTFSLLMYSYLGSAVSYEVEYLAHCIYDTKWYLLPVDMQKQLLFCLGFSQRPTTFKGLGLFTCNLAAFKEIMNMVVSVVLLLRQL